MKYFIFLLSLLILLMPVYFVLAGDGLIFSNPVSSIGTRSVSSIVGGIIKAVLGVIGSIALVLFITAGFVWMTSQGNSQKIKTATGIMLWTGVGLAVIFSSYIVLNFIFKIL